MKNLSMALVFAVVTACGGGNKAAPTGPTGGDVAAVPTTGLELGELRVVDTNKNTALVIHADGSLELEGEKIPAKVTKEGTIVRSDTGEVGLTLGADGTITGPKGETLGTLSADGVLTVNGKTMSLDATGMLVGGNPNAPQMKVEGATTVGLKRTAMFVLVVMTMGGEASDAPASGGTADPSMN